MEIIPAIDIIDGKCVRLTRGDYSTKKIYSPDPLEVALEFENAGIRRLHLIDLDGAREKKIVNSDIIKRISENTNLIIDFGGGVQSDRDIDLAFASGASMVTAGTVAVRNRQLLDNWMKNFGGEKIILGADVVGRKIAINGWQEKTGKNIVELINELLPAGLRYVICTDIGRDGMLSGPATELYNELVLLFPTVRIIASGGVKDEKDIEVLEQAGVWGVIIGKAIYEGRIDIGTLKKYLK